MLVPVLLFCLGLVLLIKGGDWFVDGATGIAHRFHVPELLIGATVVSIGTTLPEVMVSATSAVSGHGEIAYGNAVGSIICNTALVSALTFAIRPGAVDRRTFKTPVLFFFIAAAFYGGIAYFYGEYTRLVGILLLAIFLIYMTYSVLQAKKTAVPEPTDAPEAPASEEAEAPKTGFLAFYAKIRDYVLLVIGAALIAVGADLLVDNGTLIAEGLGVPESVIALTFVALGTSLPELVTAITALAKGHSSLSVGNIIGANLFNLVLVSGLSITLSPFNLPVQKTIAGMNASLVVDLPVMFGVMLIMTVPALIRQKLSRTQGISLLAIYAAFCVFQFAF